MRILAFIDVLQTIGTYALYILLFAVVLGVIVGIHEFGHFIFAKRGGILCREYAIGMGPLLWKKKKGETQYSLRAIPLGGFCAIAGEEVEADPFKDKEYIKLDIKDNVIKGFYLEDENPKIDYPRYKIVSYDIYDEAQTGKLFMTVLNDQQDEITFDVDPQAMLYYKKDEMQIAPYNRTLGSKSLGRRAMVMFGGPLMNFVLAIVMFFIAALLLGFSDTSSTRLDEVTEGNPSYVAGLQKDDVILELSSGDLKSGTLKDWNDLSKFMDEYSSSKSVTDTITVKYLRSEEEKVTELKPMIVIYSISMVQDITSEKVTIAELSNKSLAYKGGLRTGDEILAIKYTGDEFDYVNVDTWKDVYDIFTANIEGHEMTLKVNRNGETVECTVNPYSKEVFDKTQSVEITSILMGVSPQVKFNLGKSIVYSFTEFYASLKNMVNTLGMLFSSSEIGIGDLSGPVGIFSLTSQAASQGFGSLLNFIGFLSVNVGFMNLLPIPALDGGRLVFVAYEAITKKKPNQKVETALITVTMLLLFGLIIFVSFNDVLRLLGVK